MGFNVSTSMGSSGDYPEDYNGILPHIWWQIAIRETNNLGFFIGSGDIVRIYSGDDGKCWDQYDTGGHPKQQLGILVEDEYPLLVAINGVTMDGLYMVYVECLSPDFWITQLFFGHPLESSSGAFIKPLTDWTRWMKSGCLGRG